MDDLDAVERSAAKLKQWGDQLDDDIETAYRGGASLGQIAKRSKKTIEGIRQKLLRRGVELRPPHTR